MGILPLIKKMKSDIFKIQLDGYVSKSLPNIHHSKDQALYIYILSVYSPFFDRVGLPLHNIHSPSPFNSIMYIFFVYLKFGHIRFYTSLPMSFLVFQPVFCLQLYVFQPIFCLQLYPTGLLPSSE